MFAALLTPDPLVAQYQAREGQDIPPEVRARMKARGRSRPPRGANPGEQAKPPENEAQSEEKKEDKDKEKKDDDDSIKRPKTPPRVPDPRELDGKFD